MNKLSFFLCWASFFPSSIVAATELEGGRHPLFSIYFFPSTDSFGVSSIYTGILVMNNNDRKDDSDPSVYGHNGDEIHHQIRTGFDFFLLLLFCYFVQREKKETSPSVYYACTLLVGSSSSEKTLKSCISTLLC